MEPFKIHVLGCGSALPTLRHNPSSQVVEIRGKFFMVDCGEGTQLQLRRSKLRFTRINSVFITHLHGDHCFGLIGMLSTFGMLGRTAPMTVYGPKELGSILAMLMTSFCTGLEYKVDFVPVDTEANKVVYEDKSLTVETVPLKHRLPCCGYLFREKPTLPHIRRDMVDFYNIPLSQINNIKNGADWIDADGNTVENERLTIPADRPRSYAYCSDTRYLPELYKYLLNVDLLYHESTYISEDSEKAKLYYHSTSKQAAMVAKAANVGKLMLGHYSSKYNDEKEILKEAKVVFDRCFLSEEGLVVDV